MNPILSILTPTIPGREAKLKELSDLIAGHSEGLPIEHLVLCDNRARSIGAKRQALADIARGQYIAFVDDDDEVTPEYCKKIVEAAKTGADVISFCQMAYVNELSSLVIFSGKNTDSPFNPGGVTARNLWHVCAWKREAVAGCLFGESNYGEDLVWCQQARGRVRTEHHIPDTLHIYRHSEETTAAPMPV